MRDDYFEDLANYTRFQLLTPFQLSTVSVNAGCGVTAPCG